MKWKDKFQKGNQFAKVFDTKVPTKSAASVTILTLVNGFQKGELHGRHVYDLLSSTIRWYFKCDSKNSTVESQKLDEITQKDHVIPVYDLCLALMAGDWLDPEQVEDFLEDTVMICRVTKDQHKELGKMPQDFYDPENLLYLDPFARYKKIGFATIWDGLSNKR